MFELNTDLYNSGVARESMSSFLVALASRSPVIELLSPLDYRRQRRGLQVGTTGDRPPGDFGTLQAWERWGAGARGWFIHGAEDNAFDEAVSRIVGTGEGESRVLRVYGRDLVIPWALGGVARFSFTDLCEQPLGAADYISLASTFVRLSPLRFVWHSTRSNNLCEYPSAGSKAYYNSDRRSGDTTECQK